jgi:hypothetical protein
MAEVPRDAEGEVVEHPEWSCPFPLFVPESHIPNEAQEEEDVVERFRSLVFEDESNRGGRRAIWGAGSSILSCPIEDEREVRIHPLLWPGPGEELSIKLRYDGVVEGAAAGGLHTPTAVFGACEGDADFATTGRSLPGHKIFTRWTDGDVFHRGTMKDSVPKIERGAHVIMKLRYPTEDEARALGGDAEDKALNKLGHGVFSVYAEGDDGSEDDPYVVYDRCLPGCGLFVKVGGVQIVGITTDASGRLVKSARKR